MSLRLRIVAAIALVLVAGSILGLGVAGLSARQWLREELTSAQKGGELAVRQAFACLNDTDQPAQALRNLIATFDDNRHLQALLIGPDGKVIAVSTPTPAEPPPGWFSALLRQDISAVRLSAPSAGGASVELRPVYADDTAAVWAEFLNLDVVLAVSCLGGAALVWLVVTRSLRPLEAVGEVLPRIGSGEYAARAPLQGPPEVIRLGRGVNEMAARLGAMHERNRVLEDQMLTLQEEERADIARDLHDEISPHLFAANVDVTMIPGLVAAGRSDAVLEQARSIQAAIAHMQRLVRDILGRLRPPHLAELGLPAAIVELVDFWRARRPEVQFEVRLPPEDGRLADETQEVVYRIVQESLSNAMRHGAPARVDISLDSAADGLRVEVRNDGTPAAAAPAGFGLTGMAERVAAAGGILDVGPATSGGWRVVARLPAEREAPQDAAA